LASQHPTVAVPVRYRRSFKALFIQKLQHAIPSFVVFGDGIDHLTHAAHGIDFWLGVAEVGVSALVMVSVILGFRALRRQTTAAHADAHHHHSVDWIDICLAAMLSVEAYAHFRATAHVPRPTILLAFAMLTIGVLHPVIARHGDRRRELRVGDDGISVPGGKFTRLTLRWPDVEAIDVGDRYATLTAVDGRSTRIDLGDVLQPTAVRDALMHARTFLDASHHALRASIESNPSNS
jgi:hypothetical protein